MAPPRKLLWRISFSTFNSCPRGRATPVSWESDSGTGAQSQWVRADQTAPRAPGWRSLVTSGSMAGSPAPAPQCNTGHPTLTSASSTPPLPASVPSSPSGKAAGLPWGSPISPPLAPCPVLNPPSLPIWAGQSPSKLSFPGPVGSPGRKGSWVGGL